MADGYLDEAHLHDHQMIARVAELLTLSQQASGQSRSQPVGAWCRDVYWRICLLPETFFDLAGPIGQHFLIPLYYAIRVGFFTIRDWRAVWLQRGITLPRQVIAQWRLMRRYRTDPSVYYSSQLYDLPGDIAEADDYVGRDEIKNGLMKQLHCLQSRVHGRRVSLGDKSIFTRHCEASGLPVAPVICVIDGGKWAFSETPAGRADYRDLDRDLFIKPVLGRGAHGVEWFEWLGGDRYRNKKGHMVGRLDVIRHLTLRSARKAILVLPKLANHQEIADLARDSLMVFRVFTCLDAQRQPHATNAMLRILAKLEPSWPENVEYAARVDLATGQLGQLCDDFHFAPDDWWDRHPHTQAQVNGRQIAQWPAIAELARTAHRAFSDRTIIGWDIALTKDGPVLIEGNAYPDTHFLQRANRQLIGKSPLAPLLGQHLAHLSRIGPTYLPRGTKRPPAPRPSPIARERA